MAPPLGGIQEDFLRRYARDQLVVCSNFAPFCTEGFRWRFVLVAFVNSRCSATSRYMFCPKITQNYSSNQFMMNFDRTVFTFLAIRFVFRTVTPDHSQPPLARISPPPPRRPAAPPSITLCRSCRSFCTTSRSKLRPQSSTVLVTPNDRITRCPSTSHGDHVPTPSPRIRHAGPGRGARGWSSASTPMPCPSPPRRLPRCRPPPPSVLPRHRGSHRIAVFVGSPAPWEITTGLSCRRLYLVHATLTSRHGGFGRVQGP